MNSKAGTDISFLKDFSPYPSRALSDDQYILRFTVIAECMRTKKKDWMDTACRKLGLGKGSITQAGRELRRAVKSGFNTIESYVKAGRPCRHDKEIEPEEI